MCIIYYISKCRQGWRALMNARLENILFLFQMFSISLIPPQSSQIQSVRPNLPYSGLLDTVRYSPLGVLFIYTEDSSKIQNIYKMYLFSKVLYLMKAFLILKIILICESIPMTELILYSVSPSSSYITLQIHDTRCMIPHHQVL